jgi:hypothetical protein
MAILRTFLRTFLRSWSRRRARVLRLALLLGIAPLASCFNPAQPGCAFSCAGDHLCPSGYSCGSDLICHRSDGQGVCAITGDAAASDAAPTDAAPKDAALTDASGG